MLTEELRERINKLSLVKRQLLNQQLRQQRAVSTSFSPILSGTAAATAPLSLYAAAGVENAVRPPHCHLL